MRLRTLPIWTLLLAGALPPDALAQMAVPPAVAASAAPLRLPDTRPPPRVQSVEESSANAAVPGDLRPERPVTPQIDIPFGQPEPVPVKPTARTRRNPAPPGGIDDAAARCQAEEDAALRAACRDRLGRAKAPK